MSARARAERDRRRALISDITGGLFAGLGVVGAIVGYARFGTPDAWALTLIVAALAMRAHAELYTLRAHVELLGERAEDPS